MRTIRKHAEKIGIKKIGIMGSSAGGHLAGIASVHYDKNFYEKIYEIDSMSAKPDFSILCYPVIDMFDYRHDSTKTNIAGIRPTKEIREFYSIYMQATDDTPPAFLWHTAADETVPAENSMLYAKALSEPNVPYELHIYPYGSHGRGLSKNDEYIAQWTTALENWLKKFF